MSLIHKKFFFKLIRPISQFFDFDIFKPKILTFLVILSVVFFIETKNKKQINVSLNNAIQNVFYDRIYTSDEKQIIKVSLKESKLFSNTLVNVYNYLPYLLSYKILKQIFEKISCLSKSSCYFLQQQSQQLPNSPLYNKFQIIIPPLQDYPLQFKGLEEKSKQPTPDIVEKIINNSYLTWGIEHNDSKINVGGILDPYFKILTLKTINENIDIIYIYLFCNNNTINGNQSFFKTNQTMQAIEQTINKQWETQSKRIFEHKAISFFSVLFDIYKTQNYYTNNNFWKEYNKKNT